MGGGDLLPGEHAVAAQRIAVLRGLYGDLGDSLDDTAGRGLLLEQIEREHAGLAALLRQLETG